MGLPSLLAIVLFFKRAHRLVLSDRKKQGLPLDHWLYLISLACMLTACAALIARLIQLSDDGSLSSPASLFGTTSLLAAWVSAIGLNYLENQYSKRSSSYIFAYYVVCVAGSAISIRTMHDTKQVHQSQFISFCVFFGSTCCGFIAEAWPRSLSARARDDKDQHTGKTTDEDWEKPTAYDQSNLFSRFCFHFMQHVISLGYRRPLQDGDIANMMPRHIQTVRSFEFISGAWNRHLQKRKLSSKTPSLLWVVFECGGWSVWSSILFFALSASAMDYLQPVLLDIILDFISSYSTDKPQSTALGIILSIGLFMAAVLSSLAMGQCILWSTNLGVELKSGLTSMIYRKSLRLSPGARREATVGEITNHMSVDAERISQTIAYMFLVISAPIEIILGFWLLYRQLGPSAFVGLGVVVLVIPVQMFIGNLLNKAKDKKLEAMDGRVRLLTEVLSGIKIVKLYSWETSFRQKIERYREKELKHLRHSGLTMAFMMIMYTSLPSIMALLSFLVYSLVSGPGGSRGTMSADTVFVSITLFNCLTKPIVMASTIFSELISLNVAVNRIQGFLLQEEIDNAQIEYQGMTQHHLGGYLKTTSESTLSTGYSGSNDESSVDSMGLAIHIRDGAFSWSSLETPSGIESTAHTHEKLLSAEAADENKDEGSSSKELHPALTNINIQIPHGSLTVIMGRVGQGKSSIVSAIIGDMYKIGGRVQVCGRMAYVPQQAWIFNDTLKNNILFGMPYDHERYDRIVTASGLTPDLKMLPAGDQTEIGEKGINLSGGQKQRVSLARAAYQDADIYLLDDPLSAVDAHVDQHLWQNLIGPSGLLKNKTRLLITHGIHHLSEVDQIIVIKAGTIDESGNYEELMAAQATFFRLISEYSVSNQKAREEVAVSTETSIGDDNEKKEFDADQGTGGGISERAKTAVALSAQCDMANETGELISEEEAAEGNVGFAVFREYVQATTYFFSFLSAFGIALSQASQIGISVWLQNWVSKERSGNHSVGMLFGVYALLLAVYVFLDISVNVVVFAVAGVRAARILHRNLLESILRLPMSFFDTTPVGRIMNRFSSDIDNVDELVPLNVSSFYYFLSWVIGTLVVISISLPIFLVFVPFLAASYLIIQAYYIRSSRALQRMYSISKSPLYQHFDETLAGVSTIRAMCAQDRFILENATKSDRSSNAFFVFTIASRWLHVRLEFLGAVVVLATSLLAVLGRETLSPGMAGLALSYALNITFAITYLVTSFTDLQNQLVSVERIQEYSTKKQEAPVEMPSDASLPPNWPSEGRIKFKNYSTRYRQGLDLVIKKISFEVQPSEKVGIVGRTGAGKSSLTLALFRIIEAANSHWAMASDNGMDSDTELTTDSIPLSSKQGMDLQAVEVEEDGGSIEIDGVDISIVGLERLRQHLAIIPQDPTLFAGTIRDNLDPFHQATDTELWEALERAHLKNYISALPDGLSYEVSHNGDNFSVGQRSLIYLARALLRKTKILILDEATAAVDVETDELIQRTIRQEFKDRTILTIAHRIKTVMDSDKILVLDRGQVSEYDSPQVLMQRQGMFYSLAQQAGEV
ncbi:hypothetical protein BGX28_009094 [Mortierella sp. GBA30]|nr:hypothetical protein BGX28_009094 [Mortierella sp. GBA30]